MLLSMQKPTKVFLLDRYNIRIFAIVVYSSTEARFGLPNMKPNFHEFGIMFDLFR